MNFWRPKLVWLLFLALALTGCGAGARLIPGAQPTPKPSPPKPVSPGANKIAYLSQDGSFWLVSPDLKDRRLLFYDPALVGKTDLHFDWAPDASKIIMDGLRLIDLATGEIKNYTRGETPKWSPTGDRILFTDVVFGSQDLYLIKTDGTNLKLIDKDVILDWGINHSRNWSPKGDKFIYTKVVEDAETGETKNEIWVADADGENKKELLDYERYGIIDVHYPTWSPRTNRVAFAVKSKLKPELSNIFNLAIFDLNNQIFRMLTEYDLAEQSVTLPTWSYGDAISWVVDNPTPLFGGVWMIDVNYPKPRQAFANTDPLRIINYPPIWLYNNAGVIDIVGGKTTPFSFITDESLDTSWFAATAGQEGCSLESPNLRYLTGAEVIVAVKKVTQPTESKWVLQIDGRTVSEVTSKISDNDVIRFSFQNQYGLRIRVVQISGFQPAGIREVRVFGLKERGGVVENIAPLMEVYCTSGNVRPSPDISIVSPGLYYIPWQPNAKPSLLFMNVSVANSSPT